ncbi:MAG: hypothetical protein J2P46_20410, partial [Zavarzinella sp.]|nr:hypothetical protein [Zavarzinella sp.]
MRLFPVPTPRSTRPAKRPRTSCRRLHLGTLEDRTVPAVNLLNNYSALLQNGFVPPDTCGAAGPSSYVETINQDIAIFTPKDTGTTSVTRSLSDFWFTQGGL